MWGCAGAGAGGWGCAGAGASAGREARAWAGAEDGQNFPCAMKRGDRARSPPWRGWRAIFTQWSKRGNRREDLLERFFFLFLSSK